MIEWLGEIDTSRLKKIFLIHGELDQQEGFKQHLIEAGYKNVEIVAPEKEYELDQNNTSKFVILKGHYFKLCHLFTDFVFDFDFLC